MSQPNTDVKFDQTDLKSLNQLQMNKNYSTDNPEITDFTKILDDLERQITQIGDYIRRNNSLLELNYDHQNHNHLNHDRISMEFTLFQMSWLSPKSIIHIQKTNVVHQLLITNPHYDNKTKVIGLWASGQPMSHSKLAKPISNYRMVFTTYAMMLDTGKTQMTVTKMSL